MSCVYIESIFNTMDLYNVQALQTLIVCTVCNRIMDIYIGQILIGAAKHQCDINFNLKGAHLHG